MIIYIPDRKCRKSQDNILAVRSESFNDKNLNRIKETYPLHLELIL